MISLLYLNKCDSKGRKNRRIGTKIPNFMKVFMGGSTFFAVLIIVFGPIFLFSSLNPTNQVNEVIGVNLKVVLQIPPSDKDKDNLHNYEITLIDNHNSKISVFYSDSDYKKFIKSKKGKELRQYTSFKYEQVQRVKVFGMSENNWDISPLVLDFFKYNTDKKLNISLMYSFSTKGNAESGSYYGNDTYVDVNYDIFEKMSDLIFGNSSETELRIEMKNVYSPYQLLQSNAAPLVFIPKKSDATLVLSKQEKGNSTFYNWNIFTENDTELDSGIEFIIISYFYSLFTFGMDVTAFYVSFVIVVGNLIRSIFLGQSERIMYSEMVNPGKLFSVCEGIKISRIKKDFLQEEKLYYLLMDLMRSPEMFKNLTMSSLIYIQDNNIVKEEIQYKEYEVESKVLVPRKKPNKKVLKSKRTLS